VNPLLVYWKPLAAALVALFAFAAGWSLGADRVRGEWAVERTSLSESARAAESAARAREQELYQQYSVAIGDRDVAYQKMEVAAVAACAESLRLRDALAAARAKLSITAATPCTGIGTAALDTLGECSGEYLKVAEAADRCDIDRKTLIFAWPH